MADVKVPLNVSSITFAASGVKTPSGAGIVTNITADEATQLCRESTKPSLVQANAGAGNIRLPAVVTGITIGGTAYVPAGGIITAVPAAHLTQFLRSYQGPILVRG